MDRMDIFCGQTLQTMWAVLYLATSFLQLEMQFPKVVVTEEVQCSSRGEPHGQRSCGKGFGGFPSQAVEVFALFVVDAGCTREPSGKQPRRENVRRNTGGVDSVSINLAMGSFKFCRYSLSEFQWWFWISQLPSRISENKSIKPNNFECRVCTGQGRRVRYRQFIRLGCADGLCFQRMGFYCCLFLAGTVLPCPVRSINSKLSTSVSPHFCMISSSGAENLVAVKSPAAAKILMHFQFPVH